MPRFKARLTIEGNGDRPMYTVVVADDLTNLAIGVRGAVKDAVRQFEHGCECGRCKECL